VRGLRLALGRGAAGPHGVRTPGGATGAAVALLALSATGAGAQAVSVLPLRSGEATFHIRATIVKDFTGHAVVSRAEYVGTDLAHLRGFVEIRAADMQTGIGLRDRHLRTAMEADSFPLLRFDLASVEPGAARGDTVDAGLAGRLTIHGVAREVRATGSVVLGQGSVEVRATFALDMRDYGIKPPVKMLGALRVAPDVAVGIDLVFSMTPTPAVPAH
jgi:polyisoprenoid-binding protein YceI